MLQSRLHAALHEIGRLQSLVQTEGEKRSRAENLVSSLRGRDQQALATSAATTAEPIASPPNRALHFELQHISFERDAALEKLAAMSAACADKTRAREQSFLSTNRLRKAVHRNVELLSELIGAISAIALPFGGAAAAHVASLMARVLDELELLRTAAAYTEDAAPVIEAAPVAEEPAPQIGADESLCTTEGDQIELPRRPLLLVQQRATTQGARLRGRGSNIKTISPPQRSAVVPTAADDAGAAQEGDRGLRSISRAAARIAQARRGLAQLQVDTPATQPPRRPRSAPGAHSCAGAPKAAIALQPAPVACPPQQQQPVSATLHAFVGDLSRENKRLQQVSNCSCWGLADRPPPSTNGVPGSSLQRVEQLHQALLNVQRSTAGSKDGPEDTSLLRSALAAARGAQLELERQLHDARGDAARAESDAQVSWKRGRWCRCSAINRHRLIVVLRSPSAVGNRCHAPRAAQSR